MKIPVVSDGFGYETRNKIAAQDGDRVEPSIVGLRWSGWIRVLKNSLYTVAVSFFSMAIH